MSVRRVHVTSVFLSLAEVVIYGKSRVEGVQIQQVRKVVRPTCKMSLQVTNAFPFPPTIIFHESYYGPCGIHNIVTKNLLRNVSAESLLLSYRDERMSYGFSDSFTTLIFFVHFRETSQ